MTLSTLSCLQFLSDSKSTIIFLEIDYYGATQFLRAILCFYIFSMLKQKLIFFRANLKNSTYEELSFAHDNAENMHTEKMPAENEYNHDNVGKAYDNLTPMTKKVQINNSFPS